MHLMLNRQHQCKKMVALLYRRIDLTQAKGPANYRGSDSHSRHIFHTDCRDGYLRRYHTCDWIHIVLYPIRVEEGSFPI